MRAEKTVLPFSGGLLYEYSLLLIGENTTFSSAYFGGQSINNDGFARLVFRQAFELFLRWKPEEIQERISPEIIKRMRLDKIIPYMDLPQEISWNKDPKLITAYVYPEIYPVNSEELVLAVYKSVENGSLAKFPKRYFDGQIGRFRGCTCLRYLIGQYVKKSSVREIYEFFASPEGVSLINSHSLKLVLKDVFHSPVAFCHEALPKAQRDDFWYHYYEFQYQYEKEKVFREKHLKSERLILERQELERKAIAAGEPLPKGRRRRKKKKDTKKADPVSSADNKNPAT